MAILNLCRTISIYQPFREIPIKAALLPVLIYTTVILLDTTFPLWFGTFYKPDDDGVQCNYNVGNILPFDTVQFKVYFTIHTSVNRVIIPGIIILCCLLSSIKIWTTRATKVQSMMRSDGKVNTRHKRRLEATTTVVLLGMIYVVLNLPYNVVYVKHLYHTWSGTAW